MNWTLIWPDNLLNELARQYVRAKFAGQGTAFTHAVHRLETRLCTDPFADTESRGGNVRVIFEAPVTVYFRVDRAQSRVTVHGIIFTRPRTR